MKPPNLTFRRRLHRHVWLTLKKPGAPMKVKIRGVEAGGIWFESDLLTARSEAAMQTMVSRGALSKSCRPVYFLPFSELAYAAWYGTPEFPLPRGSEDLDPPAPL
jgi:hypothetical protein